MAAKIETKSGECPEGNEIETGEEAVCKGGETHN